MAITTTYERTAELRDGAFATLTDDPVALFKLKQRWQIGTHGLFLGECDYGIIGSMPIETTEDFFDLIVKARREVELIKLAPEYQESEAHWRSEAKKIADYIQKKGPDLAR